MLPGTFEWLNILSVPSSSPQGYTARELSLYMNTLASLVRGLVFCSAGMVGAASFAADVTFQSGSTSVALIELYTSEGCSSCPPAEQWLATLRNESALWTRFVPVAFHVNYWDHLGWRDALASPAFTAREQAYAATWDAASVYTPCFVRNGLEWRPRDGTRPTSAAPAADAGALTLTWRPESNTAQLDYTGSKHGKLPATLEVSVALLGSGIVSNVRKGENAGRELRHEFVALRLETVRLARGAAGTWSATITLAPRPEIAAPRHALAAWVTKRGELTPLQATGGWID